MDRAWWLPKLKACKHWIRISPGSAVTPDPSNAQRNAVNPKVQMSSARIPASPRSRGISANSTTSASTASPQSSPMVRPLWPRSLR